MANVDTYENLSKDEIIDKEKAKLKGILTRLDPKTKKTVESMVNEAAFMSASLYELRQIINKKGYTEYYQNGANQSGIKKCAEVEIYISLSKNYDTYIKTLTNLLPKEDLVKQPASDGFEDFVAGRDD